MISSTATSRALFIGPVGEVTGDHDVVCLEKDIKPYETGFPDQSFDIIVACETLERMPTRKVPECLNEWYRILKPGGALHIQVPNIRWAARNIMRSDFNPAVLTTLYGTQNAEDEFHKTGATLDILRGLLEAKGFNIKIATVLPWEIKCSDGEVITAEKVYVAGEKA